MTDRRLNKAISYRQRGATLIEAIIVVGIVAIISAAIAPLIQAAAKASTRIHNAANNTEDINRTMRTLERLIDQMSPIDGVEGSGGALVGSAREITLHTHDAATGGPTPMRVAITAGQPQRLVLHLGEPDQHAEPIVLLTSFNNGAFSYYKTSNSGKRGVWVGVWRDRTAPKSLRFQATDMLGGPILLEFSSQTNGRLHCAFDPISRRCRN